MASDFNKLVDDIETETREQGPAAEKEWEDLRAKLRLANQRIDALRTSP